MNLERLRAILCIMLAVTALGSAAALAAPPGEVTNLSMAADKTTVSWDAEPSADTYNLYRGYTHELSLDFLGVTLEPEMTGMSYADPIEPVDGVGFFYLVTASNTDGEGPMGNRYVGGSSAPRANNHPWPGYDVAGRWDGLRSWPVFAIHMVMLHNGKVMTWEGTTEPTPVYTWDPVTDTFDAPTNPSTDLFCAGHSFLPDGKVFISGGHVLFGGSTGPPWTWVYDPDANSWTQGPTMANGRYYPTQVTLGDGRVALFSGTMEDGANNIEVEVYDPDTDQLELLPDADHWSYVYPAHHLLPDGTIVHTGPEPFTFRFDMEAQTWDWFTSTLFGWRGTSRGDFGSVLLPPDKWRIMNFGGVSPTTEEGTATGEIIDMSAPDPQWVWTTPMLFARDHPNTVILPDATVLAIGGGADHHTPAYPSEIFDPATETWTVAATMKSLLRGYHSSAVLLPDGRVMSAGGNEPCPCPRTAEFYSPPYLFKGPQPVISSAPTTVNYGETFDVFTPQAAEIDNVVFIRPSAVTHSRNMTQRYVGLDFTAGAGSLQATAPTDPNEAPPGYYMLFLVDDDGVPSVAKFVRLGS